MFVDYFGANESHKFLERTMPPLDDASGLHVALGSFELLKGCEPFDGLHDVRRWPEGTIRHSRYAIRETRNACVGTLRLYRDDFPVAMGAVLVFATLFVVMNMVADLLCAVLDPRVRAA